MFEHHAMIDEKDTFAFEELPHSLATFPLCVRDGDWWILLVCAGDEI